MPDNTKNNGPVSLSLIDTASTGYRGDARAATGANQSGRITPQYCEECGGRLIRNGYCFSCVNCGWGACS